MTGHRFRRGLAAALLATLAASFVGRSGADTAPSDSAWRIQQRCPVNTLYVVLRLYCKDVSYQEILEQLPIDREGSSLADMRDFAARRGLPGRVLKLPPEKLSQVRFPVIAHLEGDHFEGEAATYGHFIVLLQVGQNEEGFSKVEYIDGTTGMTAFMSAVEFRQRWTGFVLAFDPQSAGTGLLLPAAMSLGGLLVALTLIMRLGRGGTGRKDGRVLETGTSV
jgi:Peptidase C39 family